MKITLKATHYNFLMEDIITWATAENQINIFITNIEFIPYDGEYISAVISYREIY